MRRRLAIGFGLIVCHLVATAAMPTFATAPAQEISLPRRLRDDRITEAYLWVDTREMFDSAGTLLRDPAILPVGWRHAAVFATIQRLYEQQRSGTEPRRCIPLRMSSSGLPHPGSEQTPTDRFADLLSGAHSLVRGEVVNVAGGFVNGVYPGMMLEVHVSDARPSSPAQEAPNTLFVFYPAGEVPFGATTLCPKHDTYWPPVPRIGAEIVVFPEASNELSESSPPVLRLNPNGREIAFEHEGRVVAPNSIAGIVGSRAAPSIDFFWERAVRSFARKS